jgi:hypothetical protein
MAVCTIEMAATIASIPNVLFHAALPLRRPNLRVRPKSPLNLSILVLNFITMITFVILAVNVTACPIWHTILAITVFFTCKGFIS